MSDETRSMQPQTGEPLYLPLFVGTLAGVVAWGIAVAVGHRSGFFPSFFVAGVVGTGVALGLFATEQLAPSRSTFAVKGTPENPELRSWLFYWILVVLLTFGFASAGMILLLGLTSGGPLVVGVGVPMTTIYFLFLLSRYSTRSFSHDVREPLRDLSEHIRQMDTQSAELNKLVGSLVGSTVALSGAVQQLVDLERKDPNRVREERIANLPHLWFRGMGTPPAKVFMEIENRGANGVLSTISLDSGYGVQRIGWTARQISQGERIKLEIASMDKKTKAMQIRIECEVQSIPPGKSMVQTAAVNCTQLKSGWGTPQGVEVSPADPQDGMKGAV